MRRLVLVSTLLFSAFTFTLVRADEAADIGKEIQRLEAQRDAIRAKEAEQKRQARLEELEGYLKVFPVDGLSLGKPVVRMRCPCEQYGIYRAGDHVGDVYSESQVGKYRFTKYVFVSSVSEVLKKAELISSDFVPKSDEVGIGFTINVSPDAEALLKAWGGGVQDDWIDYGSDERALHIDLETKSVDIKAAGNIIVIKIMNHGGSKMVATVQKGDVISIQDVP